ncbi:MAG: helix-turn-helix domain-containing protein [Halofilum sp. (in: g-proteobacteria)]|nr:helix-turn-helix domain-containing protein [Halofilum sp. (in: g-proteobacteria)]
MATQAPGFTRGCPLDGLLRLLGAQWTPHLLWVLSHEGPTRFGALRRRLDGISSKVLTERLRSLEAEGIVYRDHVPTIPPQVTYGLTAKGRELADVLGGLDHVAARWHLPETARAREQAARTAS